MANDAPILLAEDNEDDIFLIQRAFQLAEVANPLLVVRDGQEVIWYLSGEGVYADRAAYPWPCVLLLDLKMPVQDGLEVLAWLQRRRRPKDLRVVVLTASKRDTDLARALEMGADAYWVKPQDFDELLTIVRALQQQILSSFATLPAWVAARRREGRL